MDSTKLWLKISGSITYYFKSYPTDWTPEDLWIDYMNYALPDEGDGIHTYLDKQTMERVVVDEVLLSKAKVAFFNRLEKRKALESRVSEPISKAAIVVDFESFKKNRK